MKIVRDRQFLASLRGILKYIAADSIGNAKSFKAGLDEKLKMLPLFPYKFRQSIYDDDSKVRDFIFKGYVIPYLVDKHGGRIVLLDIFKWVNRPAEK